MKMNDTQTARRAVAAIALFSVAAALGAQTAAPATPLTVDEAVRKALAADARVAGALLDWNAARSKEKEARLRRIPALSLSANYTRLSEVNSSITFAGNTIDIPSTENAFTFAANLQYPVFAGFRLKESERLAGLQARGKEIAAEATRTAVAFETRRAYWEAARARANEGMLKENLALRERELTVVEHKVAQGAALYADQLDAKTRRDQAEMDLGDAAERTERSFLLLDSLVSGGDDRNGAVPAVERLILASAPDAPASGEISADKLAGTGAADALVAAALDTRPETRSAALAADMADAGLRLAEAPLYPTVALNGNYTFADPNSRVYFGGDQFTGTWSVGITFGYDLGGAPANLAAKEAARSTAEKSAADRRRQREAVALDARTCLSAYRRAERDVGMVERMLGQAREAERVARTRVANGAAGDLDLLGASISRLRSEFTILNKQIDLRIAAADLARAAGLGGGE